MSEQAVYVLLIVMLPVGMALAFISGWHFGRAKEIAMQIKERTRNG